MRIILSADSNIFNGKGPFTTNAGGGSSITPKPVDSEVFYESVDLISEGPIEGLADSFGNTLNYVDLSIDKTDVSNSNLSYGIYFNDIPIRDPKSNLYNVSSSNGILNVGSENPSIKTKPSSLYEYKSKIYDLDGKGPFGVVGADVSNHLKTWDGDNAQDPFVVYMNAAKLARVFSHYVKNKYTNFVKVVVSIDELYRVDRSGTTLSAAINFIVSVQNSLKQKSVFLLFSGNYFAKQNASLLSFDIEITEDDRIGLSTNSQFIISIYSLSDRIPAVTGDDLYVRSFSVNSIIEYLSYDFSYPFTAYCKNTISSKHFSSIPTRSFDVKLLKVLVPDNYDSEAREYIGDWSGNFGKALKWTDNPAWIFYDLCTNSRYGLARSFMSENDLNKWELLKISKFCDALLKTNCETKYAPHEFYLSSSVFLNLQKDDMLFNTIFTVTTETVEELYLKYPSGSIIYLYDLKDGNKQDIDLNVKKIVILIFKQEINNTVFTFIRLMNDFGPRKFIESDSSDKFFSDLKNLLGEAPVTRNIEDKIKFYAYKYAVGIVSSDARDEQVSRDFVDREIFDKSLNVHMGKCVAKHESFDDFLENRFSANLIINNESEGLKVLSDLSSIFRGIFYFRNGFLNLTSDVPKNVVYVFNNANVKDGLFTYSSSQFNGFHSVAKVSYSDKNDNFKDKIVYVDDAELIQKTGVVETEILGFGVTSKYQARRLGKWFLATQKLESQTVSFSGGVEISMLKISDVIRISDALKNSNLIYGKIESFDFENNCVYIDREVSEDCLGKLIKIISLINSELRELTYFIESVDNVNLKLKLISQAYVSWNVIQKVIVSSDNRTVSGDNIGSASFTRKCFSKQSYIDGCQFSFNVVDPLAFLICGLSAINNPTVDASDINYGLYIANGYLFIINNGTISASPVASNIKNTSALKIIFDGKSVVYYLDDQSLRSDTVGVGPPLHAVVAFNTPQASINNIDFAPYPDHEYGNYAYLRSGAAFTVYLKNYTDDSDLYRIVSISENSVNDYSVSALKYSKQKFDYVEKDEYVDSFQNDQKEIIFSADNYISPAFTDSEIESFFNLGYLSNRDSNYSKTINKVYDYSFHLEDETLVAYYSINRYQELTIDFISIFNNIKIASNFNVFGLKCIITKGGKNLTFTIEKANSKFIKIFLGQTVLSSDSFSPQYSIDFYAYDKNKKIILV
jgi:hypothetical protein